jgi:hypothetical protein
MLFPAALLAAVSAGAFFFSRQISQPAPVDQALSPEIKLTAAPVQSMPKSAPPEHQPAPQAAKTSTTIRPAASRNKSLKIQKPERKTNFSRRPARRENAPGGEFYAVTFAGSPGEAGEDLRIIRADLPRSSLFALGVNLPVENETTKIKTDLLVGADGVVRAIRLVE